MATIVFDFDSTLIAEESLELVLARVPGMDTARLERIAAITRDGMEGRLPFRDSLEQRVAIAAPKRVDVVAVGRELRAALTDGASALLDDLLAAGHAVEIVSGGFAELIEACFPRLADGHVHAVRPLWGDDGAFVGLDDADPFATSKVAGVAALGPAWARPIIGVGDGATDLALFDAGLVDHFVAYVEHARRETVVARGVPTVGNIAELRATLATLLS